MIITLCGSARFEPWFRMWEEALGLSGHCVFSLVGFPSQHDGEKEWYTPEQKSRLDTLHFVKISKSDAVLFLNVFAYVGESTMREFHFSQNAGKQVHFLESWGEGCGVTDGWRTWPAKRYFGIAPDYMSPIKTSGYRDPWYFLPDSGGYRSSIVANVKRREAAAMMLVGEP